MPRCLVLAHRKELIYQAVAHARTAGLEVGIEMGPSRASNETVIVSSVQTQIAKRKCRACLNVEGEVEACQVCGGRGKIRRFERFNPQDFGLLICDEAHHSTADTYRLVFEWYRQNHDLKIMLVTATPKRTDKTGLHNVCDSVAYKMELRTAIDEGWLVKPRQRFITLDWLDLSEVKTKAGGDLADGEVQRAFLSEISDEELTKLHAIAKPTLEEAKGKPTLVFAAGQDHAEKLTAAFNSYDGVTAEMVIDKTDPDERKRIIQRYKDRETQVLVGCMVFSEGFDAPGTEVVAIARPTKSELTYTQFIGRGTRPLPGVVDGPETAEERKAAIAASDKPCCIILDFVGNSGRHKLVSVADVLGGADVEPIDLEAALSEAREATEPVDMDELLEKAKQAREEAEKRKAEEEEKHRLAMTKRRADRAEYNATDVDLFDGRTFDPFNDYKPQPWQATQAQVNRLMAMGVEPDVAIKYSKGQAGKVISEMKAKQTGPDFRMPFGKHKGQPLKDIPRSYLDFLISKGIPKPELMGHINQMRGVKTAPVQDDYDVNAALAEAYEDAPF